MFAAVTFCRRQNASLMSCALSSPTHPSDPAKLLAELAENDTRTRRNATASPPSDMARAVAAWNLHGWDRKTLCREVPDSCGAENEDRQTIGRGRSREIAHWVHALVTI